MADFLNLYKVKNLKTGKISDFLDEEELKDVVFHWKYDNKNIEDYAIYCLNMQNITPYLDIEKLLGE